MDPYIVLGIPRNSTLREIKLSYICLARKYHPDKNNNDKSIVRKFQEIEYAYTQITKPEYLFSGKPAPAPVPKSAPVPKPAPVPKSAPVPKPAPKPAPAPFPKPRFKKGQNLDDFLSDLVSDGKKKTKKPIIN